MTSTEAAIPDAPDAELAARFTRIDAEEAVFRLLTPSPETLAAARIAFVQSGYTSLPDLRPRGVNRDELSGWEAHYDELIPDILHAPFSSQVQHAYLWRREENIANLRLIRAAADGNPTEFNRYNNFIYGEPSRPVAAAVAEWFCQDATRALNSARPEVQYVARQVLDAVGRFASNRTSVLPDAETFAAVRADHYTVTGFLATLLAGVELPEGMIDARIGDPALRQMLQNIGSTQEIIDAPSWSNTPATLRRPRDYAMAAQEFLEFNGHELSHAVEKVNAERGPLRLLATGLDRYEIGNEGRGVVREQLLNEDLRAFNDSARWQEILGRQLAVSLGAGVFGGKPMNFAEAFRVVHAVTKLYELPHSPEADMTAALQRAEDAAWNLSVSVYKGTNGDGRAVYGRAKIYLEGNLAVWCAAQQDPQIVQAGDLGKFDVSNQRHLRILQAAGIVVRR